MWRKYWGEVRWLALYSAVGLIVLTLLAVSNPASVRVRSHSELEFIMYNGTYLELILPTVIIAIALLLGIGGLGHERSSGTALFTLSLPVTRRSVMTGRFLAGAAALLLLSLGAEVGVAVIAAVEGFGSQFTPGVAVTAGCFLAAGGLTIYAFSFLAANVTAHTIRTVATVATILILIVFGAGAPNATHELHSLSWWLQPVNFLRLMGGGGYLMTGRLPWSALLIALAVTIAFLEVAIRWVDRHDF